MKYKCLVLDHDDTIVNSTATVHYPSFVEFAKIHKPELHFSLEEYIKYNFDPGVLPFFKDICGFSEEELILEQDFWKNYQSHHVSYAFAGIRDFLIKYKKEGGIIVVVSHSFSDKIVRDYIYNGLPMPDMIFGWEEPIEERKPSTVPLQKIMKKYHLKPNELLVIDDLKPGLMMAKAANVPFAAAGWCFDIPENKAYMEKHADYYFDSVSQLARHCE